MKKILFFLGVLLTIAITSCNKCYECEYSSFSSEFCEDDYSKNQLDQLKSDCENYGGDWHLSID